MSKFKSEMEELASLVGGGEEVDLDTQNLFAASLKESLSGVPLKSEDFNEDYSYEDDNKIKREELSYSSKYPIEQILLTLFDIHDNLKTLFEKIDLESDNSKILSEEINRIGSCIVNLGGEVEFFDPLSHSSGLELPSDKKNAEEVINRTIKYYRSGNITEAKIGEDGKTISITFEGEKNGIEYRAKGLISCDYWDGSEAIDYVHVNGGGKMSVKFFENGKWVEKDDCRVDWELEEVNQDNE